MSFPCWLPGQCGSQRAVGEPHRLAVVVPIAVVVGTCNYGINVD